MTRSLIALVLLALCPLLSLGCGSTRVGTNPEDASRQTSGDQAEIPTAGIDRQTETTPIVTVDIERSPTEPTHPAPTGE